MARVQLLAVGLEFDEGGHTLWVHGPEGTVLRIKCTGKITTKVCAASCPHADVQVHGDIDFCIPESDTAEEGSYVH